MKKKILITAVILLLCVGISIYYLYIDDQKYKDIIYPGVYIKDVDVSFMSADEAIIKLQRRTKKILNDNYTLNFKDKTWHIKTGDAVIISLDEAVDKACSMGKSSNFIKNFITRYKMRTNPVIIEPVVSFNEKRNLSVFREISAEVYIEPKNASFEITDDKVNIIKEINGIELDDTKLKVNILKKVWDDDKFLEIPLRTVMPEITAERLAAMNINVKVCEYSTKFNKALKERTQNIKLAASILDGYILAPEQIFSFNEVVGERTKEKGYKEAPIFVNNRTVPGIGGGVCQLSSTLYNVALLMDLEIIERSNHSLPVSYVPLGRDATVNYGTLDFKFKNITNDYLLIKCLVENDNLTVAFFGSKPSDKNINLQTEIVRKIPPPVKIINDNSLENGKTKLIEGSPGYQVRLYKIYDNNGEKQKVLISTDTYNPTPSFLYVGQKPIPKEIVSQPEDQDEDTTNSDIS